MNSEEKETYQPSKELEIDAISTDRLTQSWNGFTNIDSRQFLEQQADEIKMKTHTFSTNSERNIHSKPRFSNYHSFEPSHNKLLKMPKTFPGVKTSKYMAEKSEEIPETKIVKTENEAETKLTLDDIEKVLTPRRERNSRVKPRREEKLPRIRVTKAKTDNSNEDKLGNANPQASSHAFNCARMLTELNDVCTLKSTGVAGKSEDNLLQLKTVHEARRYSAFTRRCSRERPRHNRCQSLPNLRTRELPKRFFVKLDPLRASAMPVNLSSWNETSRRCRFLSENLDRLDKQGTAPSEEERKALIGQWIRETSQLDYQDCHVSAEVET